MTAGRRPVDVEWQNVEHAYRVQSGVPAPVSMPSARTSAGQAVPLTGPGTERTMRRRGKEKRRGVTAASSCGSLNDRLGDYLPRSTS